MRAAIHLHTNFSFDSDRTVVDLLATARRERVDCVAITDHDEIDAALEAAERERHARRPLRVIVGEEVSTREGHLIGLFLHEWIPPGLSAGETIERIHEQGGVAVAPHPFATLCDNSLGAAAERIAPRLDAIEIHNAQNPLAWQDAAARRLALRHGLAGLVGIDGHLRGRLAPAWQELDDFATPREFLDSLRGARFVRGRFGAGYFLRMGRRHAWDQVMPGHLPGFGVNARPGRGEPPRAARPWTRSPIAAADARP